MTCSTTQRAPGWAALLIPLVLASAVPTALAQPENNDKAAAPQSETQTSALDEHSPWLLAPIFSSNPKLGTSVGALGGYLHYFDAKSRPSIFALSGQYSSTHSMVTGAFTRASFDEDHQRVLAGLVFGNIKNDYDDYLGSGVPLRNDAELRSLVLRYTYRFTGNWFGGVQAIKQNFNIAGATSFDDQVLDILGIQPYQSAGAGVVLQNDSRDNENMPTRGWLLNLNNMAFRESLGGDYDYDAYRLEIKNFTPFGNGNVFALRLSNHLTNDAPVSARAPVQLRGYKVGQYTSEYMSSLEGEARLRLADKWTATIFAGAACLYGGKTCSDRENVFLSGGAGVQYILKPKEGIVMNLELADGKGSNSGAYLKMGYAF